MANEIQGLKELMKKLEDMGEKGKEMTEDILKDSAKIMKDEVEREAPDYKGKHPMEQKYGKLKKNIKVEYEKTTDTVFITTGDSFWAAFQEYGTKSIKKNPFMERSYLAKKDEVQKEIILKAKKRLGLK